MDTNENIETKKTKKKSFPLVIFLLLLLICLALAGAFAYAKYITSRSGQITAQAAEFHFALKNIQGDSTDTAQSGTISFPMTRTDGNSQIETGKIAPETYGRFDIIIDSTGTKVAYRYDIDVTVTNCPTNLIFYSDSAYQNPITTTRTQETVQNQTVKTATFTISKYVPLNRADEEHKEIIYWNWLYETGNNASDIQANDIIDSADMDKTVTMAIQVVGRQVQSQPQGVAVVGTQPDSADSSNILLSGLTNNTIQLRPGQSANIGLTYDGNDTNLEDLSVRSNNDQIATATLQNGNIVVTATSITTATTTIEVYGENSLVTKSFTVSVDGVKAGDIINYNPSGTYEWKKSLATSNETGILTLTSGSGNSFEINQWYVLSVNGSNITMVPTAPSSGTVALRGAQGYNNAVKLLNDACSSLYSNSSKGITARSINIGDIENVINNYGNTSTLTTAQTSYGYNTQKYNAYSSSNSKYPKIYASENKSVINGNTKDSGLGLSAQSTFIQRATGNNDNGSITNATSIQPFQTYYYLGNNDLVTALGGNDSIYRKVLLNNSTPSYWVASRCVSLISDYCYFDVSNVNSGNLRADGVFHSDGGAGSEPRGLFPVVSLNADVLATTNTAGTYQVQ